MSFRWRNVMYGYKWCSSAERCDLETPSCLGHVQRSWLKIGESQKSRGRLFGFGTSSTTWNNSRPSGPAGRLRFPRQWRQTEHKMRTGRSSLRAAGPATWICRRCSRTSISVASSQRASLSSKHARIGRKVTGKRTTALIAASGLSAGTLAFSEDIKHGYAAAERSGRVVSTLFICINEYASILRGADYSADFYAQLSCHTESQSGK